MAVDDRESAEPAGRVREPPGETPWSLTTHVEHVRSTLLGQLAQATSVAFERAWRRTQPDYARWSRPGLVARLGWLRHTGQVEVAAGALDAMSDDDLRTLLLDADGRMR